MLVNPARTSTRALTLVASLALAAGLGLALQIATSDQPVEGTATFEIVGIVYEFAPTTCTITDSGFLTAGAGTIDGEDFWASASPYGAGLTLGTSEPPGQSDDERVWIRSTDEVSWSRAGNSVEADVMMQDERRLDAQVTGHLSVTCD